MKKTASPNSQTPDQAVLKNIISRAHYLATQMIFQANHRSDKEKGDPKIGGHVSASASSLHILGALHLIVKTGFDHIANKPHASPTDHAYNYLLKLFLNSDFTRLSEADCDQAMMGLRAFSQNGEPVFQSYHSAYDCDHHNFFPSGTVGIPPVKAGYMALAYRYAADHGYDVPKDAHFWAVAGDSEFREGSMFEAVPDFAERELGNLTWILDYNRQSLDGHRINNKKMMGGTDGQRIERTFIANGWEVIQVQHGSKRLELFSRAGGQAFQNFLENELEDYELQSLLLVQDMQLLKKGLIKDHPQLKSFLQQVSDQELFEALRDLGGHDLMTMARAMHDSKLNRRKPTLIIAHTVKGWGLRCAAAPGNHSALPTEDEILELQKKQNLDVLFKGFGADCPEGQFLKRRGDFLLGQILEQKNLKEKNQKYFLKKLTENGEIPPTLDINLKMASYPHTQWMLGQLTAKLTRLANTKTESSAKPLSDFEKKWKEASELLVSMAPDVGTSTNLNPAMDGKIFGAPVVIDFEAENGVKDTKTPDLVPGEEASDRFIRFEIVESNVMSCVGAFGRLRDTLGVPIIPLMTVYDFFIKRALDQYFYNLYWKSSFICVGTPSGVTLSPEGAQHGWKSDFQIPNQITWEPFFCQELDWILSDAIKRHVLMDNEGRTGVLIRGVTRGIEQKDFLFNLKRQKRFKQNADALLCLADFTMKPTADGPNIQVESELESLSDAEIFAVIQNDVLQGAYSLIDYHGYAGFEPGDNVVQIISMGSPTTEAIKASEALLAQGIYANVVVVTSPDLFCGLLADQNDFSYLKNNFGLSGDLIVHPTEYMNGHEFMAIAGKRTPVVSVHDGEVGLLDNLGSILGVKQISLAVKKHSKCGRPEDVYKYHHIDSASVVQACQKVLQETALENVKISQTVLRSQGASPEKNSKKVESHESRRN